MYPPPLQGIRQQASHAINLRALSTMAQCIRTLNSTYPHTMPTLHCDCLFMPTSCKKFSLYPFSLNVNLSFDYIFMQSIMLTNAHPSLGPFLLYQSKKADTLASAIEPRTSALLCCSLRTYKCRCLCGLEFLFFPLASIVSRFPPSPP